MSGSFERLKQDVLHAFRRRRADARLAQLSRSDGAPAVKSVLVDGVWDNPNYWVRYAMLRAALNLGAAREVGLTGRFNGPRVRRTMRRLGIKRNVEFFSLVRSGESRGAAERLVSAAKHPDDILRWELPHGVPAAYLYDGILKRQRKGSVDLADPRLVEHVTEALDCIVAAERLFDREPFELVLVSHQCNFLHTALVWLAMRRRIPVVMLWNIYGTLRFSKILDERTFREWSDLPSKQQLEGFDPIRAEKLAAAGGAYLDSRLGGRTRDAVAVLAYQRPQLEISRAWLRAQFGWDPDRPLIAVYAPNWFDFPHSSGLSAFRDYQEWLQATVEFAKRETKAYWLIKGHPWDDAYGGVTLRDVMPSLAGSDHVRVVEKTWRGRSVMEAADGLITCQGTAGVEFASLGRPVLVSDAGWYHEAGFVICPESREAYFATLASDWWKGADAARLAFRARLFSGFYFCRPAWQESFLLREDLDQWDIYRTLGAQLDAGASVIDREKALLRRWWASGERGYHTYKMLETDDYSC